jgi:peptidoglycan/xylan/chitin deacetylase (PgdA/CDA1 family)
MTQHADVCSLDRLVHGVRSGRSTRPFLAVTFDDGYRDNLSVATPMLEQSETPATVFVAPPAEDGVREMWWDELARLVVPPSAAEVDITWTLSRVDDPTPAHATFRRLFADIRRESPARRNEILADLRNRQSWVALAPQYPLLESEEIVRLGTSPAVEVGGHTVTHPILARLSASEQFEEILGSRIRLAQILGRPPSVFAYPFGTPADYNKDSVRAVSRAGYDLGCANFASRVGRGSPKLELPRVLVRDWTGEEFERRLAGMLDGRM